MIYGFSLGANTTNFTIGGTSPGDGNVVAGYTTSDVRINASGVSNIYLLGNKIGMTADGSTTIPLTFSGPQSGVVYIKTASNIYLGDGTEQGRNVIAGSRLQDNDIMITDNVNGVFLSGNYIGLNSSGTAKLGLGNGILCSDFEANNTTNIQIGGPNPGDRNIINGETSLMVTSCDGALIQNNYIGTDKDGNILASSSGYVFRFASNGLEIRSNLIRSGQFGIYNEQQEASPNFLITQNTISDASRTGIFLSSLFGNPASATEGIIENNFIGGSSSQPGGVDPFFGISVGNNANGIEANGASTLIFGNIITGNTRNGIRLFLSGFFSPSDDSFFSRLDCSFLPCYPTKLQIGGTQSVGANLCLDIGINDANTTTNGANCIHGNSWRGIYSIETISTNENTLYTDNDFTGGNGASNINIEQAWYGDLEVFSGVNRRTDLGGSPITITFPANTRVLTSEDPSSIVLTGTSGKVACEDGSGSCPANGDTKGEDGNTLLYPFTTLGYAFEQYRISQYTINTSGVRTDYDTFKFDQNHFTSDTFTFDGNSITDPVVTGVERTTSWGDTTYDRGEYWTLSTTADRDLSTNKIGTFQQMEVDIVDANPMWDGSKYVITVDATTNEDNVSTEGLDTGDGAYSGGGTNGVDGLPNGKTSLREAIIVANNFAQPVTIGFNIPVTDTNHLKYQDDGVGGTFNANNATVAYNAGNADVDSPDWYQIQTTGTYTITANNLTIDGYTQSGASVNTVTMGGTLNTVLKIETKQATWNLNGAGITVKGLEMTGVAAGATIVNLNGANGNFNGNYLGVDISGSVTRGVNNGVTIANSGNTVGSNLDTSNDDAEINIINNSANTTSNSITISAAVSNLKINENYLNTDKSATKATGTFKTARGIYISGTGSGTMDNLHIEKNIIANNHFFLANNSTANYQYNNLQIINNRMNTNWDGTLILNNRQNPSPTANAGGNISNSSSTISVVFNYNIVKNYEANWSFLSPPNVFFNPVDDGSIVENNTVSIALAIWGKAIRSTNISIKHNIITNSQNDSISIGNINNSIIQENIINSGCQPFFSSFLGQTVQIVGDEISLYNSSGNQIRKNKIGINSSDVVSPQNTCITIIYINGASTNNLIGGTSFDDANVVAGYTTPHNGNYPYAIYDVTVDPNINTFAYNFIGTNSTGTSMLGISNGIYLTNKANIHHNVISGVQQSAIQFTGAGAVSSASCKY